MTPTAIYVKSTIAGAQKIETVNGPMVITTDTTPVLVAVTRDIESRLERGHLTRHTGLTVKKRKGPRRLRS